MVLRDIPVLHQRVLHGQPLLPDRRQRRPPRDDRSSQAFGGTYTYDNNGRVTWAISEQAEDHGLVRVSVQGGSALADQTFNAVAGGVAHHDLAHAAVDDEVDLHRRPTNSCSKWGSLPAGARTRSRWIPTGSAHGRSGIAIARCTAVVDRRGADLSRARPDSTSTIGCRRRRSTSSASYVTGSHNAKIGIEVQRGHFWRGDNNDSTGGMWYRPRWRLRVPAFVAIQAPATGWQNNLNYNLGLFAQDRWTLNRLTLSGGVRFDLQNESTEPFTRGPHRWLPNRNVIFDAVENVPNWKDINPRVSAAYDLFGNGKTAVKGERQPQCPTGLDRHRAREQSRDTRSDAAHVTNDGRWTDAAQQLLPRLRPVARCRQRRVRRRWQTPNFGSTVPGTRYDRAIMDGWGVRPSNWEFSAGVQQELVPRVSASVGYFRRINGNF